MGDANSYVDPVTGQRYRLGGCIPSGEPSPLPKLGASRLSGRELPPSVDLRQFMTPVEVQGNTNSCSANALAGAYEFLIMKNHKKHIDVSRLFIYYNARLDEDGKNKYSMRDDGSVIEKGIKGLKKYGCCKENLFEFNEQAVNERPPDFCYEEGKKYRIESANSVPIDVYQMKQCLAEGFPFVFGIRAYQSFHNAGDNGGRVPMPKLPHESQNTEHGLHAMLAVGYSDLSKCFFVKNSWGENWGDKGYCYIPYDYMGDEKLCFDAHTIKVVSGKPSRYEEEEHTPIENPYNWNDDKDKPYYIPPNYNDDFFDYEFFWKYDDSFNYMIDRIHDHAKKPFDAWDRSNSETHDDIQEDDDRPTILWIGEENTELLTENHPLRTYKNVSVVRCTTVADGIHLLFQLCDKIKSSSSTFQIIYCSGYADEPHDHLNLLNTLNNFDLQHIPVLILTRNKDDLENGLSNLAEIRNVDDWAQRFFITENSEELFDKAAENISVKALKQLLLKN